MANALGQNILITGNRGYIGSKLALNLQADGMDLKDGIDASDKKNYKKKYDIIVHLAAHLKPINDDDIKLHRTVAEIAKETNAHVIYASSASIYQPDNLYAMQKLYGEMLFSQYGILRFFNVYDGGNGIVDIVRNNREKVKINGNGEQTRDFVHVGDVVRAIEKAVEIKWTGIAEIGTGKAISINELLHLLGCWNYEYVNNSPGILHSEAKLNPLFPWKPQHILG
ncbi:MAG: SDR family oxidoreductase [Patescibacteria group bacterium]